MEQLTRILSRTQDYETYRSLLVDLPIHVKSRLPCIPPGCSRHRRLNMAPLDKLAYEFQREIVHSIQKIWQPLNEAGSFNRDQQEMLVALKAVQNLQSNGCSACWLHFLGSHRDASVALGALIIGRVSPEIYHKSKRLIWIEESLRQRMGRDTAEIEIQRMWEGGIGFRRVRKVAFVEGERGFVVEYARLAREMDGLGGGRGNRARTESSPLNRFVRQPPEPEARKRTPKAHSAPTPQTVWQRQEARVPSSMYSRPIPTASQQRPDSSGPSWRNTPRPDLSPSSTGAHIIELYRHSKLPEQTAFDARSSTDSHKRSPVNVSGQGSPENAQGTSARCARSQERRRL